MVWFCDNPLGLGLGARSWEGFKLKLWSVATATMAYGIIWLQSENVRDSRAAGEGTVNSSPRD